MAKQEIPIPFSIYATSSFSQNRKIGNNSGRKRIKISCKRKRQLGLEPGINICKTVCTKTIRRRGVHTLTRNAVIIKRTEILA